MAYLKALIFSKGRFFLLSNTSSDYNNFIAKDCDLTVLVLRRGNEEVLLQSVASVYGYQKADSASGNRKLYCFMLGSHLVFSVFGPPSFGRLFYAPEIR